MNTDSRYQLADRYLDGLTTDEDAAALTEAVEADPDVLAFLCESAEMEAGLQTLLTPEARAFAVPRVLPFWHWRRAGKWLSAGAAAAALLTIAAVVLWPRGGAGGKTAHQRTEFSVRRLTMGEAHTIPSAAPDAGEPVSLEERVFFPRGQWLYELQNVVLSGENGYAKPAEIKVLDNVQDDRFLEKYLCAAGVTFSREAGVAWVDVEGEGAGQPAFRVVNTPENLDRIAAIELDPVRFAPGVAALEFSVWKLKPGGEVPPRLAIEKVLTSSERKMPRPAPAESFSQSLMPRSTIYRAFLNDTPSGQTPGGQRVYSDLKMNFIRVGDSMLLSGLSGTPPPGNNTGDMNHADMEFSLALTHGQEAVLHLGRKADGCDWILSIQAHLVPFLADKPLQDITLGVKPAVMQFDKKEITVKAGAPVRLTCRNETCPLPHNFVLIKPGRLDAAGQQADMMLRNEPEARSRNFLPSGEDVIVTGSALLTARQSEVIYFMAPVEPGDYPYLCTFPGHWRLHHGVLRVVK